ncbi:hypothetical protein PR002_g4480 [Phytophthora rubi]|uniref:RxLR effector protein n=1 Tax=Phytophthora rubi TaxID=129364 RepID=A0A6A3NJE6_9STRA|nr:hypothetical protein PR002_g4480 [Phytophthora rubi]
MNIIKLTIATGLAMLKFGVAATRKKKSARNTKMTSMRKSSNSKYAPASFTNPPTQ